MFHKSNIYIIFVRIMRVMRIAKMYKKKCWKSSITHHCGDANQNQRGCHFTPIWMTTIKEIRDNKFQAVEETECCWGLVWMQIDAAIRETRVESPKETKKKKKIKPFTWASNSSAMNISNKISSWPNNYL